MSVPSINEFARARASDEFRCWCIFAICCSNMTICGSTANIGLGGPWLDVQGYCLFTWVQIVLAFMMTFSIPCAIFRSLIRAFKVRSSILLMPDSRDCLIFSLHIIAISFTSTSFFSFSSLLAFALVIQPPGWPPHLQLSPSSPPPMQQFSVIVRSFGRLVSLSFGGLFASSSLDISLKLKVSVFLGNFFRRLLIISLVSQGKTSLYALMAFATMPYGIQPLSLCFILISAHTLERNEDRRALEAKEVFPALEAAETTLRFTFLLLFLQLLIDFSNISKGGRQREGAQKNFSTY